MSSGCLLVMVLNLTGPIPNAAAINSHQPDSVLLIRSKSDTRKGEKLLDESFNRLHAWANGTLPELYEFDPDIELINRGVSCFPEVLDSAPTVELLEVESLSCSTEEISEMIAKICDSQEDLELRIDVAAGRKEDAAILARLPLEIDLNDGCTVWYTDATSGISVEIGGQGEEGGGRAFSQIDRFWLNGSPVLDFQKIYWAQAMNRELLTSVLDSVEEINKSPKKEQSERIDLLIEDLDGRGIKVEKEHWGYKAHPEGSDKSWIPLPKGLWGGSGYWLEHIAALAIVEGWECERVYVGISIGHHKHEQRMGSLRSQLSNIGFGRHLSRSWSDLEEEEMLPSEFSGLDFLDSKSFNPRKYRKEYYSENYKELGRFAAWIAVNWRELPLSMREYLTPLCLVRDLDVFAETASNCLFVECKLKPDSGKGKTVVDNKAQIDSIIALSAMRGVNYSILTHARDEIDIWRSSTFDFVAPWGKLRRPEEMLKSVIKMSSTYRHPYEKDGSPKKKDGSQSSGGRRRPRRRRSKSKKKDDSPKKDGEPRWGAW